MKAPIAQAAAEAASAPGCVCFSFWGLEIRIRKIMHFKTTNEAKAAPPPQAARDEAAATTQAVGGNAAAAPSSSVLSGAAASFVASHPNSPCPVSAVSTKPSFACPGHTYGVKTTNRAAATLAHVVVLDVFFLRSMCS
jgi:hypothetical protein